MFRRDGQCARVNIGAACTPCSANNVHHVVCEYVHVTTSIVRLNMVVVGYNMKVDIAGVVRLAKQ